MQQYNFPTTIYFGEDALEALAETLREKKYGKILLVTDQTLTSLGMTNKVCKALKSSGAEFIIFDKVTPNPQEDDVEAGVKMFKEHDCQALIALGGGSPMDTAKVIKVAATHPGPLAQYDDLMGGEKLIVNFMPPLYAIPTTAGTGSVVGRCGVIILRSTKRKTVIFSPALMPDIAVLAPQLTADLPPHITAATGIDAFTHSLEAYLAGDFHPMADGLALKGMGLCLTNLLSCYENGDNITARGNMQLAAVMGATAFQKGLGMIHSLAHPLSAHYYMHHGLANAILLPAVMEFFEESALNKEQEAKLHVVHELFEKADLGQRTLADSCRGWIRKMDIALKLKHYDIPEHKLEFLAGEAFEDPCHRGNLTAIDQSDLLRVYRKAY
ncbi:MAG: iron-containing alcohol dehydrogenase [Lentisphaeraceae bacterium]|nr:iron-containing alcohol dehydrogenase [Lentisphaeraceae bacterium]